MRGDRNTSATRLSMPKAVFFAAVLVCLCSAMIACRKTSQAASAGKVEDPATAELHAIGDRAATAVIARDTNTLLEYDHDADDETSLKNRSGDLYCYLFDSTCISGPNKRTVYDLFSTAPKLGIDASVTSLAGREYGLIMFYDKSQISESELYSPDFPCSEKGLKGTTSWRFMRENGKWSTTTLFEYKTDRPCKQQSSK